MNIKVGDLVVYKGGSTYKGTDVDLLQNGFIGVVRDIDVEIDYECDRMIVFVEFHNKIRSNLVSKVEIPFNGYLDYDESHVNWIEEECLEVVTPQSEKYNELIEYSKYIKEFDGSFDGEPVCFGEFMDNEYECMRSRDY
jgi:hypothetical protein